MKKGDVSFQTVLLILGIVGFMVIFAMVIPLLVGTSEHLRTQVCELVIGTQGMARNTATDAAANLLGLQEFMNQIQVRCPPSVQKVDADTKEELFRDVGDEMLSCWNRYGSGEYDFLSSYEVSGTWCLPCAKLTFDGDVQGRYSYSEDFISWLENNKVENDEHQRTYAQRMKIVYSEADDEELREINREIISFVQNPDFEGSLVDFTNVLSEEFQELVDLRTRTIDTQSEMYVVYHYTYVDKDLGEIMDKATLGIGAGVLAAVAAEVVISTAVGTGVGFVGGAGIGAVPGFIAGFTKGIVGAVNKINSVGKVVSHIAKMERLSHRLRSLTKFSGSTEEAAAGLVVKSAGATGKTYEISRKIADFKATRTELTEFADVARASGNLHTAEGYEIIVDWMDEFEIKDLAALDAKIKADLKKSAELKESYKNEKIEQFLNDDLMLDELEAAMKQDERLMKSVDDLKALRDLAKEQLANPQEVAGDLAFTDYLKASIPIGSGIGGAYVASGVNTDNRQYVELLSKDEYYRVCGAMPPEFTK